MVVFEAGCFLGRTINHEICAAGEALALLTYGFNLLPEFAGEMGPLDAAKSDELRAAGRTTLLGLGE